MAASRDVSAPRVIGVLLFGFVGVPLLWGLAIGVPPYLWEEGPDRVGGVMLVVLGIAIGAYFGVAEGENRERRRAEARLEQ